MWPFKKETKSNLLKLLDKINKLLIEAQELKYESDQIMGGVGQLKIYPATEQNLAALGIKNIRMDAITNRLRQIHIEIMKLNPVTSR